MARYQRAPAGHTLIWEGEDIPLIANVIGGVLKLVAADGREQSVGLVFPSDFIGRPFGKKNPYRVTALTDTKTCIHNPTASTPLPRRIRICSTSCSAARSMNSTARKRASNSPSAASRSPTFRA